MTQPISVVVLSTDLDSFNALRLALGEDSRAQLLAGGTDAEQIYEQVVSLKPSAAIVMLGDDVSPAITLIQRITKECPATAIVSAAREASSGPILQTLRAGAREFLRLPVNADELRTVLDRIGQSIAAAEPAAPPPKKKGKMVAVFSSKGGCGTSFIATNLAACTKARALLVDLNLQAGDLPLFLGVNPHYTLAALLESHSRVDDQLISAVVSECDSTLHLVAAPKESDYFEKIKREHVIKVLQRLRESYDLIVLDPQHTFDPVTVASLDESDEIVLVSTLDIPAVRSTQRSLETFDRLGYPRRKIHIVVNRWSKQADLDLLKVEHVLRTTVAGTIQSDYETAVASINLGRPLIRSNPNSKLAREIRHIAHHVFPDIKRIEGSETKRRWWAVLPMRQPVRTAPS